MLRSIRKSTHAGRAYNSQSVKNSQLVRILMVGSEKPIEK